MTQRVIISGPLLIVALLSSAEAVAWQTTPCGSDPSLRLAYPGDVVWPLALHATATPGSAAEGAIQRGVASWNAVPGARDVLRVEGDGLNVCGLDQGDERVLIGMDDGTCMAWAGNAWAPSQTGSTIFWQDRCVLTRVVTWVNSGWPQHPDGLTNTFTHELGHVLYYDHNWDNLSVMGYAWLGTPPMTFLTANDHAYLRALFPQSHNPAPDLFIHAFAQLDALGQDIVEGSASYGATPPPRCSRGCDNLAPGDTVEIVVTVGDAGAAPAQAVELRLTLGPWELGAWIIDDLAAERSLTLRLTGVVPDEVRDGDWPLVARIDPDDLIAELEGAAAPNDLPLGALTVACSGCGAPDPDPAPDANPEPDADAEPTDAPPGDDATADEAPPNPEADAEPEGADAPDDEIGKADGPGGAFVEDPDRSDEPRAASCASAPLTRPAPLGLALMMSLLLAACARRLRP